MFALFPTNTKVGHTVCGSSIVSRIFGGHGDCSFELLDSFSSRTLLVYAEDQTRQTFLAGCGINRNTRKMEYILYNRKFSGENMRLCISVTVQVHENKSMLAFCDDNVRCTGFVSLMDLIVYIRLQCTVNIWR